MKKAERSGLIWVVVAAVLWSSGGLGIKAVPEPALVVAFWRSAVAAVALLIWFRPFRVRLTLPFVMAVLSYAACLTTFVMATRMTTAANAIFLQYSGVVWVLILSPLALKERLRTRDVIAIVVALFGMALFFLGRFDASGIAGNLTALASGLFFAILVMALRFVRGAGAEAAVTWGNVVLAMVLVPFIGGELMPQSLTSGAVLVGLGLFQIGIAYAFFVKGLETITATQASLTGMLEPVLNPIWVLLVIGERPGVWSIVGGMIVLGAIAWRTIVVEPTSGAEESIAPPD